MDRKTLVAGVVALLVLAGSLAFYFWNEKLRPRAEAAERQQQALVHSCKVHAAARQGDLALLEQMIAAGCSVNARDEFGMTPLHLAADDRVAELLLTHGAYIDARDGRGYTPLAVMEMAGRQAVVDLLRRHGAKR